jgi:hypothetical protein
MRFRVIVGLTAILVLAAACGASDEPTAASVLDPTATVVPAAQPTNEPVATVETFVGNVVDGPGIDLVSCEGVLGPPPANLVLQTLTPNVDDWDSTPGIQSICMAMYELAYRFKGMTVTLATFDSADNATTHYQMIVESLDTDQVGLTTIGPDYSTAVANAQGVGSFVFFRQGVHAVSLHTTMPEGASPLFEPKALEGIANGVRAKLAAIQ